MLRSTRLRRAAPNIFGSRRSCAARRSFSTASSVPPLDSRPVNVVQSPFPPISSIPPRPVPEFVSCDWTRPGDGQLHNKVAVRDGTTGETRTFREYYNNMTTIAANLKYEMSISEDSCVALFAPNHVDFVPICLSVALCGAKLTPVGPQYKAKELEAILENSRSEVLFAHWSNIDVALDAAYAVKSVKHVVVIPESTDDSVPVGTVSLSSLKLHKHPVQTTLDKVHGNAATHPFLVPYSSGTTGLPKGVCLSHRNIVANLLQLDEVESPCFPSDHKLISPLPFFHIYGFLVSALYCAWRGQELITISGRFDLDLFCQLVEKHKPQRAHLVPPILVGLAKSPIVDKYDMSSLAMIISAAAPLSRETEQAVWNKINCKVKQGWGMSELSPLGTMTSDYNIKSGSVGQLVASTDGKVIDLETHGCLGPNKVGELMIRGPQVMMGYLNDPKKTAECLNSNGWLRTGDLAYYDEEGFFFIADRLKEMIKVRGFQVAPAELESLLLTNPHVNDAAVVSVASEECGELPRAYIVLENDALSQNMTEEEVKEWVKERVAPCKRLTGGVVFTDEIPKSVSGKILRRLLRDKAKAEVSH